MTHEHPRDRLIRLKDVMAQTGYGRTSIYAMMRDGRFPQPVRDDGALRFSENEVQAWIDERKAARIQKWAA
ncbi:MAG: AlpA family phage regulatory protein [Hyphomicrobiales bacterium]|nr:MAG: AlpA family phage regulatory protein [Hyphomicrobiales bacterium]